MVSDYAAWNYFQSLERAENRQFVGKFKAKYGTDRVVSDAIAMAYSSVRLCAQAVEEGDSADVETSTLGLAIGVTPPVTIPPSRLRESDQADTVAYAQATFGKGAPGLRHQSVPAHPQHIDRDE